MQKRKTTRAVRALSNERDISELEQAPYRELVPARNIYEVFETNALLHGDRPALTLLQSGDPQDVGASYTYRELLAEITRAANMLYALGIRRQGVVSVLARTHARVPAILWGAETVGIASCINYLLAPETIAALLEAEQARILVCPGPALDPELWAKAQAVVERARGLEAVLVLGAGTTPMPSARFHDLDQLMEAQPHDRLLGSSLPDADDIAALFHTGGTTGLPKLVPQTHGNQIHAAWSLAQLFHLSEQDVCLNGFPWFHVGGTSTLGLSSLSSAGHQIILSPAGFRDTSVVKNIWRLVEHYSATVLGGVPTAIGSMSGVPADGHDLSSLRFVMTGGSVLPTAVAKRFEQRTGVPLIEQYGMTETVAAIATTPVNGKHIRGSVGVRCPYSEISIKKPGSDGGYVDCAPGEIGLVTVRGPQVFGGYLEPAHNAGVFTPDGCFITGDLGYLDEAGYLFLSGREKDLIIRSGHNIDPSSIEEVANSHPAVALSAAVGMPDEYAGEVPVVFVEPLPGQRLDIGELMDFIALRIHEPPAKPRQVFLIEEIPVTAVGKVFKPQLRELAIRYKLRDVVGDVGDALELVEIVALDGAPESFEVRVRPTGRAEFAPAAEALTRALAELPVRVQLAALPVR